MSFSKRQQSNSTITTTTTHSFRRRHRWGLAFLLAVAALSHIAPAQEIIDFGASNRQESDRLQAVIAELCVNRPVNEYFRLSAESNCRDAVR